MKIVLWIPHLLVLPVLFCGLLLWRPGTQVLYFGVLARVAEPRDGEEAALGVAEPPEGVEAAEDVGHLLLPLTLRPAALPALGQLRSDLEARGVLQEALAGLLQDAERRPLEGVRVGALVVGGLGVGDALLRLLLRRRALPLSAAPTPLAARTKYDRLDGKTQLLIIVARNRVRLDGKK